MILTAPRIIAIDDKPEHLKPLLEAFQQLGAPSLGLLYDPQRGLDRQHFRGVRILIMDLNLSPSAMGTNAIPQFSEIASILDSNIHEHGGPFVVVIWTEHENRVGELIEYLDNPKVIRPFARPLTIIGLPKSKFIDLSTGSTASIDPLVNTIKQEVLQKAPLAALLSWETEVLTAVGETLSNLGDLVPDNKRTIRTFSDELQGALGHLASCSVGQQNVQTDPRGAIVSLLSPLLADRIVNQPVTGDVLKMWDAAVGPGTPSGSQPAFSGKLNRMIHVAIPGSEQILPSGWGAVVEWPTSWSAEDFNDRFGIEQQQYFCDELKITDSALQGKCTLRLVRVGAACDHAQIRPGPLQFLLGVEVPKDVRNKPSRNLPQSVWHSPKLQFGPETQPFLLAVNARFSVTVTRATVENWSAQYRLREQLLMQLITHTSTYQSRPAIVSL